LSPPASVFTQRQIFFFWLPLAASWALMSAEGPILQAVIARLPDLQTQLAAFGIVMSLEIAIESPVIMLLATSTALATSGWNFRVLRRFMIRLNVLVTVVAVVVAFTPLYDVIVLRLMGIPGGIAAAARPGMKIMTLWSAAIGLRRFLQGVLIRAGETRWIGVGTTARLVSSAGCGILLAVATPLPGVYIASLALMAGVVVEALFVLFASRPTVRRVLSSDKRDAARTLTLTDVALYHLPLAATSLLTLLAQPIIGAGLARMPNPAESLAAWPVIWGILFLFRSPAFALPEAVLALVSERRPRRQVWIFCHRTGLFSSAGLAALVLTPMLGWYLRHVAGLPPYLSVFVVPALFLALLIPYANCVHSWFRGILMHASRTKVIYWGMGLNLAVTAFAMTVGATLDARGCETAVLSLTLALLAEIYYLKRAPAGELLN
jgi:hypothetical protein